MSGYPDNWPDIAKRIKDASNWLCERCKHPHEVETGYVLTVHHLDGNKSNCADWNLVALCQRCHLRIQGRVKMDQGFFESLMPVSGWFKPHLEGYRAAMAKRQAQNQSSAPLSLPTENFPASAKPSETHATLPPARPEPDDTPSVAPR